MDRTNVMHEWKELRTAIKKQWARLTDEDLARLDESLDTFTSVLQQRYGISRESAHADLHGFLAGVREKVGEAAAHLKEAGAEAWSRGKERLREGLDAGRERLEQQWQKRRQQAAECTNRLGAAIQERPLQSLALAAGAGALLALLLRRK
jgi:ElaB/YqjD/DUF883 family membrane-anchored ribosome-binding protein